MNCTFIRINDFGYAFVFFFAQFTQFPVRIKFIRNIISRTGNTAGDFIPAGNRSAANGKINLIQQFFAVLVKSLKFQTVGMFGKKDILFKNDIFVKVKRNRLLLIEVKNFISLDGINVRHLRVNRFSFKPH